MDKSYQVMTDYGGTQVFTHLTERGVLMCLKNDVKVVFLRFPLGTHFEGFYVGLTDGVCHLIPQNPVIIGHDDDEESRIVITKDDMRHFFYGIPDYIDLCVNAFLENVIKAENITNSKQFELFKKFAKMIENNDIIVDDKKEVFVKKGKTLDY